MTEMTRTMRGRLSFLLVPLLSMVAAAACSGSESGDPAASSGGLDGSTGGSTIVGTGGAVTGGTGVGETGGTSTGTGGVSSGGTSPATGGTTGGTSTGTGGVSSGGTSPATGGTGTGTGGVSSGGTSLGTGGVSSGGTSAGAGGAATGGASMQTGGAGAGSGGAAATGGTSSGSGPMFHIFLLMGQSNMAGVAKNEAGDRNTDERLKVLGGCNQPAGQWNVANPPLNDCPGEKGWNLSDSVGPGMWFAKTIVEKLPEGDSIGLVGTAESGESINTFISGGVHHQMILNKIAAAKTAENAHFAGVIFHQGESDSGQSSWPGKVVQLYNEVKEAWGVDYDVPFILGELPQGGCCGGHNSLVHQAADQLPMGDWVSQDGTNVLDEYHFDHPSVILMGQRYGDAMLEALGW